MPRQLYEWDDWRDRTRKINEPMRLRDDAPEEIKKKFEEFRINEIKESKEKRALLRSCIISAVKNQFKEGLESTRLGVILSPEAMIDLIANYDEKGELVPSAQGRFFG